MLPNDLLFSLIEYHLFFQNQMSNLILSVSSLGRFLWANFPSSPRTSPTICYIKNQDWDFSVSYLTYNLLSPLF